MAVVPTLVQNTVNTSTQITKTTRILQKPTHKHTHTLQNKLKQPEYNLKQTQYKIYPNELVSNFKSGCFQRRKVFG